MGIIFGKGSCKATRNVHRAGPSEGFVHTLDWVVNDVKVGEKVPLRKLVAQLQMRRLDV